MDNSLLLTESEVEKTFGAALTKRRLQMWRWRGHGGPAYVRIGDRIFYRRSQVEKFLADREVVPPPGEIHRTE